MLDALEQAVADFAIGLQICSRLPWPIIRLASNVGQYSTSTAMVRVSSESLVMCFRRQRDDQVERRIVEVAQAARRVLGDVDADLVHDGNREAVRLVGANACRFT